MFGQTSKLSQKLGLFVFLKPVIRFFFISKNCVVDSCRLAISVSHYDMSIAQLLMFTSDACLVVHLNLDVLVIIVFMVVVLFASSLVKVVIRRIYFISPLDLDSCWLIVVTAHTLLFAFWFFRRLGLFWIFLWFLLFLIRVFTALPLNYRLLNLLLFYLSFRLFNIWARLGHAWVSTHRRDTSIHRHLL